MHWWKITFLMSYISTAVALRETILLCIKYQEGRLIHNLPFSSLYTWREWQRNSDDINIWILTDASHKWSLICLKEGGVLSLDPNRLLFYDVVMVYAAKQR
jgi:hypothetical protein